MKLLASGVPATTLNAPQDVGVMLPIAVPPLAGIWNLQYVSLAEPIIWGVEPESTLTVKYLLLQPEARSLIAIEVKVNVSLV